MLRRFGRLVRRRLKTLALIVTLLALAGAGGFYAYALHQWEAAQEALKNDQPVQARRSLKLCLWLWPRSASVHLLAARAARLCGDFEAAEAHLNRCKKLEHGASDAVKLEFLLMNVQGGYVDTVAPELWSCVEKDHPESALILETMSRAYMNNLRYRQALRCLSRWAQVAPDAAAPLHWRGWVLERLSDYKGAMSDYRKALELEPDRVPVRLRLAEMLLEHHKPLEAIPLLERLRKQCPDRPEVEARLGECRFQQGRLKEARRLLEAAVKKLPNDSSLLNHLARLELEEDHPERAEQWLRRALKVDPTDPSAQFTLVSSLRLQGRRKEADAAQAQYQTNQALLKQANKLLQDETDRPTGDPRTACDIGTLMLRIGQERVALYWLHEALRRQRGYPPAARALADHYEKKGQGETAAQYRRLLGPQTGSTPKGSAAPASTTAAPPTGGPHRN